MGDNGKSWGWLWKRCNKVLDPDDPCSIDMELHK